MNELVVADRASEWHRLKQVAYRLKTDIKMDENTNSRNTPLIAPDDGKAVIP